MRAKRPQKFGQSYPRNTMSATIETPHGRRRPKNARTKELLRLLDPDETPLLAVWGILSGDKIRSGTALITNRRVLFSGKLLTSRVQRSIEIADIRTVDVRTRGVGGYEVSIQGAGTELVFTHGRAKRLVHRFAEVVREQMRQR